jgi:cysteine-rich repeat protein
VARARAWPSIVVGLAASCGDAAFVCVQDSDCARGDVAGMCEASGFCSFPDDGCASGSRYGSHASTELAGECVAAHDESSTGIAETSSGAVSTMTYSPPDPSASDDGDASSSSDDGASETGVPRVCGDGILDANEDCDDGNGIDGDGCNRDCTAAGRVIWSVLDDDAIGEGAHAIARLPDGTVIAAAGSGTDDGRHVLRAHAFTPDGDPVWSQAYDTTPLVASTDAHAWGLATAEGNAIAVCGTLGGDASHWVVHSLLAVDGTASWSADGPGTCSEVRIAADGDVWMIGDDDGGARLVVLDGGMQVGSFASSWFPATAVPRDFALVSGGWISVGALDGLVADTGYVASSADGVATTIDPGPSWSIAHALVPVDDAFVIVGAVSEGLIDGEPQGDAWIGRYDGEHATATIAVAESGLDSFHDVELAPDGDVIAVGWHGPDEQKPRIVVARFDPALALRWTASITVGADGIDRAHAITIGAHGELFVAGVADLGPASAPWIARLSP